MLTSGLHWSLLVKEKDHQSRWKSGHETLKVKTFNKILFRSVLSKNFDVVDFYYNMFTIHKLKLRSKKLSPSCFLLYVMSAIHKFKLLSIKFSSSWFHNLTSSDIPSLFS